MRVYHLAKEQGLPGRVLLGMLHARGIEVPSHMCLLEEPHAVYLREAIATHKAGGGVFPTAAPGAAGPAGVRRPGAAPGAVGSVLER